eukprot:CAMPEP_0172390966 /NCGR_PEP_ID=MMETSP1061-20121228/7502_1 /TAXON_ID=37318 /ORGANISM="Pseudo-nitzschia pungens, Strain cf. pungens" /LENGTH=345 /DNA_ID=CAMNT_0013121483 /DNA_START=413 /DNA_END=1450 /DNA_ORIENTATION=-
MASTHQDFAQRLNNSAALCMEVGYHDRAIASLQRALKLCEDRFHDSNSVGSEATTATATVANCTLDDCIAFSETSSLASTIQSNISSISSISSNSSNTTTTTTSSESTGPSDDTSSARSTKRRRLDRIPTSSSRNNESTTSHSPGTYVYRTPIRIPKQGSGNQQQGLGSVLYLVVVFNLALAHQLKALELGRRLQRSRNSCGSSPSNNVARLASQSVHKSRLLYELLVEYWSKLQHDPEQDNDSPTTATAAAAATASNSTTQSLRFRMVLSNNLSRIYRWAGETFKERSCLEDLLSAVLMEQHLLCCSATTMRRSQQYQRHGTVLDGFLSNTATLATDHLSAGAA